jgi:hypothetical protein
MRSAVAVALATACALGLGACHTRHTSGPSFGRSASVGCQVIADSPDRDSDEAPTQVVGRVRFFCDRPGPGRLTLTIRLQTRTADGWVTVASRRFTTGGTPTTRTQQARYRVRTVSAPCSDGIFRTEVSGRSIFRGRITRYQDVSSQFAFPCRGGLLN